MAGPFVVGLLSLLVLVASVHSLTLCHTDCECNAQKAPLNICSSCSNGACNKVAECPGDTVCTLDPTLSDFYQTYRCLQHTELRPCLIDSDCSHSVVDHVLPDFRRRQLVHYAGQCLPLFKTCRYMLAGVTRNVTALDVGFLAYNPYSCGTTTKPCANGVDCYQGSSLELRLPGLQCGDDKKCQPSGTLGTESCTSDRDCAHLETTRCHKCIHSAVIDGNSNWSQRNVCVPLISANAPTHAAPLPNSGSLLCDDLGLHIVRPCSSDLDCVTPDIDHSRRDCLICEQQSRQCKRRHSCTDKSRYCVNAQVGLAPATACSNSVVECTIDSDCSAMRQAKCIHLGMATNGQKRIGYCRENVDVVQVTPATSAVRAVAPVPQHAPPPTPIPVPVSAPVPAPVPVQAPVRAPVSVPPPVRAAPKSSGQKFASVSDNKFRQMNTTPTGTPADTAALSWTIIIVIIVVAFAFLLLIVTMLWNWSPSSTTPSSDRQYRPKDTMTPTGAKRPNGTMKRKQ